MYIKQFTPEGHIELETLSRETKEPAREIIRLWRHPEARGPDWCKPMGLLTYLRWDAPDCYLIPIGKTEIRGHHISFTVDPDNSLGLDKRYGLGAMIRQKAMRDGFKSATLRSVSDEGELIGYRLQFLRNTN